MAENESRTCAHEPCNCPVQPGQKYCSDSCRDAGSREVEIGCSCQHPNCRAAV